MAVFLVAAAVVAAVGAAMWPRPDASLRPRTEEEIAAEHPVLGRITAEAVDEKGAPVPGATVDARRVARAYAPLDRRWFADGAGRGGVESPDLLDAPKAPELVASAVTDVSGLAKLQVPVDADYEISLRGGAPGLDLGTWVRLTADDPEAHLFLWPLRARLLRLRVVDSRGQPMEGATAEPANAGSWTLRTIFPPAERRLGSGEIAVGVPAEGDAWFYVRVPGRRGMARFSLRNPEPGAEPRPLAWPAASIVSGRVLDSKGRPLPGAEVRIGVLPDGESLPLLFFLAAARADGEGRYRIDELPAGRVSYLRASAPGLSFAEGDRSEPDRRLAPGVEAKWDLVLHRGGAVAGVVAEVGSGNPIASAEVFLGPLRPGAAPGSRTRIVTAGARGDYSFQDVPPGRYAVAARSGEHAQLSLLAAMANDLGGRYTSPVPLPEAIVVLMEEGETVLRDLRLAPNVAISGRAVGADGRAAAGVALRLRPTERRLPAYDWRPYAVFSALLGRTAEDGTFRISCPRVGEGWTLEATGQDGVARVVDPLQAPHEVPGADLVLQLAPWGRASGRIVDERGAGRGGVILSTRGFRATAVTSPDGSFRFDRLPPWLDGPPTCAVDGPGGRCLPRPVALVPEGSVDAGDGVTVVPDPARVRGVLLDRAGRPFAGVEVAIRSGSRIQWTRARTDVDGSFAAYVPAGPVRLTLSMPVEDSWKEVEVEPAGIAPLEHGKFRADRPTAPPPVTLHVTVLDDTGRRVPVCRVSTGDHWSYEPMDGSRLYADVIGGETRLDVYGSPPYVLRVSAPSDAAGRPLPLRATLTSVESAADPVVVRLTRGADLRGRVVDAEGRGLEGVRVEEEHFGRAAAWTDAEGGFALRGLEPEEAVTLQVVAQREFVESETQEVRVGGPEPVFRLERGVEVAGRVRLPDGRPAQDARITATWEGSRKYLESKVRARTDGSGGFRIRGVPAGARVRLSVDAPDGAVGVLAETRVENAPAGSTDLEVRLGGGAFVSGVLVRPDGTPIPRMLVEAREPAGEHRRTSTGSTTTDDAGRFRIEGLPRGPHVLHWTSEIGLRLGGPTPVDAPAASERIEMPLERLSGRVEGARKPGWKLQVLPTPRAEDDLFRPAKLALDSHGAFALDVRSDREYVLFAWNESGDDRFLLSGAVRAGVLAELPLEEGRFLEGKVEDENGRPVSHVVVEAQHDDGWGLTTRSDASGAFLFRGVPPGQWSLKTAGYPRLTADDPVPAGSKGIRLHPYRFR